MVDGSVTDTGVDVVAQAVRRVYLLPPNETLPHGEKRPITRWKLTTLTRHGKLSSALNSEAVSSCRERGDWCSCWKISKESPGMTPSGANTVAGWNFRDAGALVSLIPIPVK